MGLIIKHTLKSMWAHKMRTFLLLFCVSICSLAAMLCFDMSGSLEQAVKANNAKAFGKADIIVTASYDLDDDFAKGIPESTVLELSTSSTVFTKHIVGTYDMLTQKACSISGVDIPKAKEMGVLPNDAEIGDMQAAVSKDFADEFGYSAGDTITLYSNAKQPVDFTVSGLYGDNVGLFSSGDTIVISNESMKSLYGGSDTGTRLAYIDIADDEEINSAVQTLESNLPSANVQAVFENEQTQEMIGNITRIFTILFAVCLLLVIFVTVSASQRIITEKMPVIGTFRSLGISSRLTYTVLLGENIAYGLIGSAIGICIYSVLRPMIYSSQFGSSENAGKMSIGAVAGVIIFCVALECLCPVKEILSAVKTSIRDIIFSNKDTQYRHGRVSTVSGILLAVITFVTAFFSENFFAGLICFVSTAVGAALLFPYILRFISGLLVKIFDRQNTAEYVLNNYSTLNRCLLIKLNQSFDPAELSFFTENKASYLAFIYDFLEWVCQNYDELRTKAVNELAAWRSDYRKYDASKYEGLHRVLRTKHLLEITLSIFKLFLKEKLKLDTKMIDRFSTKLEASIDNCINDTLGYIDISKCESGYDFIIPLINEVLYQQLDDIVTKDWKEYHKAMKTAAKRGTLPEFIFFYDGQCLCVKGDTLVAWLKQVNKLEVKPTKQAVSKQLHYHGLLKVVGGEYVSHINIPEKPKGDYYQIYLSRLKELDQNRQRKKYGKVIKDFYNLYWAGECRGSSYYGTWGDNRSHSTDNKSKSEAHKGTKRDKASCHRYDIDWSKRKKVPQGQSKQ